MTELTQAYKTIIDGLPDIVIVLDEGGCVVDVNEAGQVSDVVPSSILGKPLTQFFSFAGFQHVIDTQDQGYHEFEWNSHSYSVNYRKIAPIDHASFKLIILHDISKIKLLEKTNSDLSDAFKFSYDGMFICDGNGVANKYNEAYCRITGIRAEEIMGLSMPEVVSKGYVSESATLKVLQTRKPATTMPQLKSGNKVIITSTPVFDENNNIVRIVANVRDITELLAIKDQMEQAKELSERYYSEIIHLRSEYLNIDGFITESSNMRTIVSTALKAAVTDTVVLITGESGSGKEVLARIIHNNSEFKTGPFVKINCSAIPETLLESELFGYEKGAFTSAQKTGKIGLFEVASDGTLFLDEIGELPLLMQTKLLGVLQDMKFTRLGGTKEIDLRARIIVATNRELEEMVRNRQFRKDLFYRINVVGLKIPPLVERKDDIFPLVNHFLRKFNEKYKTSNTISPQVMNAFLNYDWPGNIRELENLMKRLIILAPNEQITMDMMSDVFWGRPNMPCSAAAPSAGLKNIMENVERRLIQSWVKKGYSSYKIAKELSINQSTVIRKMKKLGIGNHINAELHQ
jgi:PAS domain S-box-containing protein